MTQIQEGMARKVKETLNNLCSGVNKEFFEFGNDRFKTDQLIVFQAKLLEAEKILYS